MAKSDLIYVNAWKNFAREAGDDPTRGRYANSTKLNLVINLKTAKARVIKVPLTLAGRGRRGDRIKPPPRHTPLLHLLTTGYDVVDGARSRRRITVRCLPRLLTAAVGTYFT